METSCTDSEFIPDSKVEGVQVCDNRMLDKYSMIDNFNSNRRAGYYRVSVSLT